jgi:hypothetical protein
MKILILGPLDYPTAREHLQTLNIAKNIYSSYFTLESLLASSVLSGSEFAQTAVALEISKVLTEKEYETYDIHYGLVPKSRHFDKVICYNFNVLSSQETYVSMGFRDFGNIFYTSADTTDKVESLVDVLRIIQPRTATGN